MQVELNSPAVSEDDARKIQEALDLTNKEPAAENTPAGEEHETDEVSGRVDEEIDNARSEEDREAIRARRRQEQKDRKQRVREREAAQRRQIEQLTGQVAALQQRVAQVNNGFVGTQIQQLRQGHAQAEAAAGHFQKLYADAVSAGDGEAAARAMADMQNAQRAAAQYGAQAQQAEASLRAAPSARPGGAPTPQMNPDMVQKGGAFMAANTWFKGHNSKEPDSVVLTALDGALAAEGWDPSTDEYWEELTARAKRYLPHRYAAAPSVQTGYNSPNGAPRQTTAGSGGNSSGGVSKGSFNLSAERVQAMKDGGLWEDPIKRRKAIENYRKYDAENR